MKKQKWIVEFINKVDLPWGLSKEQLEEMRKEVEQLTSENARLTEQLENSAQLIKDYKHFIEYDIERLYYIIETAEREETENENNMSVWSVGYDTDYDSYEQMTALEERIGNRVLSRLVAELKKGVKLRKIGTAEAEARLKELEVSNAKN